jgi:hypothetical protein
MTAYTTSTGEHGTDQIPTSSRDCVKVSEIAPTSDRGLSFLECAAPLGSLSLEWVAALLLPGRSYHNTKPKRRHPFERQKNLKGRRTPNKGMQGAE